MLSAYQQDTRTLLRDSNKRFYTDNELTRFINEARVEIAKITSCITVLVSGSAPAGDEAVPGSAIPGAFTPGSTATTTFQTIPNVEKYSFSYANAYVRNVTAGIGNIIDVVDVAVSWSSMRPLLRWCPWEDLQAYSRAYSMQMTSYPYFWSTSGYGDNGIVWLFPVPSIVMEMEWDCACVPTPLYTDADPEALPELSRSAVKFYTAYLAFMASERMAMANSMLAHFTNEVVINTTSSNRGKVPDYYWYEGG